MAVFRGFTQINKLERNYYNRFLVYYLGYLTEPTPVIQLPLVAGHAALNIYAKVVGANVPVLS